MNISNYIDFINTLIANKNRIAIKENINGVFVEHTYNDLVSDINNVACYIKDKGIVNKNIAIVSENSYRWIVVFLGIILSNNTAVPDVKIIHTIASILFLYDSNVGFIPILLVYSISSSMQITSHSLPISLNA